MGECKAFKLPNLETVRSTDAALQDLSSAHMAYMQSTDFVPPLPEHGAEPGQGFDRGAAAAQTAAAAADAVGRTSTQQPEAVVQESVPTSVPTATAQDPVSTPCQIPHCSLPGMCRQSPPFYPFVLVWLPAVQPHVEEAGQQQKRRGAV